MDAIWATISIIGLTKIPIEVGGTCSIFPDIVAFLGNIGQPNPEQAIARPINAIQIISSRSLLFGISDVNQGAPLTLTVL